jgi:heme oxygenase
MTKKEPWPILREATAAAHRRLEEVPRIARIFADDYRREELAELLAVMRAIHRPLERVLAGGCDLAAFGYRPRTPLLDADLAALDWRGDIADRPFVAPAGAASLLGVCYVVEGSMLGGVAIRKRLIERFGPAILAVCSFYAPYGEEAGEHWRRFRGELDARIASQDDLDACLAAALVTFQHFERALA